MTSAELISSGILESYLLGTATAEEAALVKRMEIEFPEVRTELDEIERALISCAEESVQPVSASSRQNTASAIFGKPQAKVLNMKAESSQRSNLMKMGVAAAVALLVGSVITNYVLFKNLQYTGKHLQDEKLQRENLVTTKSIAEKKVTDLKAQLDALLVPGNKMVPLSGTAKEPKAAGTVIWNPASEKVYLHLASLPPAPEGSQYQLWAIVDGKPVDAGLVLPAFSPGQVLEMKQARNAQAFAITLEKGGGSDTPTLEAMVMIGNV